MCRASPACHPGPELTTGVGLAQAQSDWVSLRRLESWWERGGRRALASAAGDDTLTSAQLLGESTARKRSFSRWAALSHRRRGAAALVRQKHEEAAEAAAAAKIQGVCRGRIARRALSPRLAAAKQEQQQEPEPEPEPELVDVPVEEVRTAACGRLFLAGLRLRTDAPLCPGASRACGATALGLGAGAERDSACDLFRQQSGRVVSPASVGFGPKRLPQRR